MKVLIAMSGGVDSSVAAALLKEQGYECLGVTMVLACATKASDRGCCSLESVNDAQKVAKMLGIPHYTLNFKEEFKKCVIDNFIAEYKNGRTPNPCIRCNQFIKFDYLLKKADELGCEKIATGHYVRIQNLKLQTSNLKTTENYKLLKGKDTKKDQSYVLYMLNQETLARVLFPLGEMTKQEVRQKAKALGLPVHDKAESQEICFVEDDNYAGFIKEKCPEAVKPGKIVDTKGNVVGQHDGVAFFTLGQRKGIGAHQGQPKYVVKIDVKTNTVVIGDQEDLMGKELVARDLTFVSGQLPAQPLKIKAKIRYNSIEAPAVLEMLGKEQEEGKVIFEKPQRAITPGQSVVFYNGEEVLGGGIIR
ncbi:tRNA 2-thiouridine(34) synthase MnmA [Candidatus Saganbacteria bacterium CG08_land_8_20_14_0_20_45_16]|uniref:tRNA-specific 2-thiouridylase MnmA n=1 Tax=Candidatus Saganbacteria bacterium CG08_land_8_20_14_0_20_45_16 TaxID=2014293 RepID=A0A2H0Y1W6_UNCSA|nr:MAG: tRNA 2-thiouridine(34) synthase MnmA [Candidatus Saganbacteria bacterium CG08_land_8_20_14_0_20_45_16]